MFSGYVIRSYGPLRSDMWAIRDLSKHNILMCNNRKLQCGQKSKSTVQSEIALVANWIIIICLESGWLRALDPVVMLAVA